MLVPMRHGRPGMIFSLLEVEARRVVTDHKRLRKGFEQGIQRYNHFYFYCYDVGRYGWWAGSDTDGGRAAQSVDEVLTWSVGCFAQRHIAADSERQQSALRRASRVVARVEAHQLRQLVELLELASESMPHNAALAPSLCSLLVCVKTMPRLRYTCRYAPYSEDLGALAGVVAQFLLSPNASLEQAAFDALFALISSTRKDDHRSDPPPRTPTPDSVRALERASGLTLTLTQVLAQSKSALARQSHACELLLLLCRASAPACELASAADAELVVLRMLQEVGDTSGLTRGGWVGGRASLEPARETSQHASSSHLHAAAEAPRCRHSIDAIFDEDDSPLPLHAPPGLTLNPTRASRRPYR